MFCKKPRRGRDSIAQGEVRGGGRSPGSETDTEERPNGPRCCHRIADDYLERPPATSRILTNSAIIRLLREASSF